MATKRPQIESFISGYVQDRHTLRIVAQLDQLKDAGSTASSLQKWIRPEKKWTMFPLDWHATRVCVYYVDKERHTVATGPAGWFYDGTATTNHEEQIDASLDGPKRRGDIRDLRLIGGRLYVCGMSRQVYRREDKNCWSRQDEGVLKPKGSFDLVGFNAIRGTSEEDLFAVGFSGEIWRRHNFKWQQMDSPTNLVLTDLCIVSSQLMFACGQQGTLLKYAGHHWEVISQASTDDDFWGLEWFHDKLYVATTDALYTLAAPFDTLKKVKLGMKGRFTFSHLHANDGVLLSVGAKHVVFTEDGTAWIDTEA